VDEHTWTLDIQQQYSDSDNDDFDYSLENCFQQLSVESESDEGENNRQTVKKMCTQSTSKPADDDTNLIQREYDANLQKMSHLLPSVLESMKQNGHLQTWIQLNKSELRQ
jgi:hypothetical protein